LNPRCVDRRLAVHPVAGEDHHAAHRVPEPVELIVLRLRDLLDNPGRCRVPDEGRDHGIAGELELSEGGTVMQVDARSGVAQLEGNPAREGPAPQALVVLPERGTVTVRVLPARVHPEVV
jgi:hypothetical protein